MFRGAGWNVIKVIWGSKWDELLAKDNDGVLLNQMNTTVDGEFQRYSVENGAYIRDHFFGPDPRLRQMVAHLSDDDLRQPAPRRPRLPQALRRVQGRHREPRLGRADGDPVQDDQGLDARARHRGPQRHAPDQEDDQGPAARRCATGCTCTTRSPTSAFDGDHPPYFRPAEDSIEYQYMMERRKALGGSIPKRITARPPAARRCPTTARSPSCAPARATQAVSTTMGFTRLLRNLCPRRAQFGQRVVPIIPDEARTFGMDSLFRELKIYASQGQKYEPVDHDLLLSATPRRPTVRSSRRASPRPARWPASSPPAPRTPPAACRWCRSTPSIRCSASSASATSSGRPPTPAPAASCWAPPPGARRCSARACSTRTATAWCSPRPCRPCQAYDPAFAYEVGAIVQAGMHRMYGGGPPSDPDVFYYLTLYNENYPMPAMPERRRGRATAIVRGPLPLGADAPGGHVDAGDDPVLRLGARRRPRGRGRAGRALRRRRRAVVGHVVQGAARGGPRRPSAGTACTPSQEPRTPAGRRAARPSRTGPIVAVTDFMKIVPEQVARFVPGRTFVPLGTDGMGRSDTREALRRFFEIDAGHVVVGVLVGLLADGRGRRRGGRGRHPPLRHRPRRRRPLPGLMLRWGLTPTVTVDRMTRWMPP